MPSEIAVTSADAPSNNSNAPRNGATVHFRMLDRLQGCQQSALKFLCEQNRAKLRGIRILVGTLMTGCHEEFFMQQGKTKNCPKSAQTCPNYFSIHKQDCSFNKHILTDSNGLTLDFRLAVTGVR